MAKEVIEMHLARQIKTAMDGGETAKEFTKYLLLEKAHVMADGVKQTTEVSKGLKQVIRHQQARKFYVTLNKKGKVIMENEVFDSVD